MPYGTEHLRTVTSPDCRRPGLPGDCCRWDVLGRARVDGFRPLEGIGGAGADGALDAGQRVGLGAALGRSGDEVDGDRGAAADADEVDAVAAIERVVARSTLQQVAAGLAAQDIVAAEALRSGWRRAWPRIVLLPSVPVSTSLLGEGVIERVWLRSVAPMSAYRPGMDHRAALMFALLRCKALFRVMAQSHNNEIFETA